MYYIEKKNTRGTYYPSRYAKKRVRTTEAIFCGKIYTYIEFPHIGLYIESAEYSFLPQDAREFNFTIPHMPTVNLESHIITVPKILCIGRNYIEHAREMKADVPTTPVFFLKPPTALIPNGGAIHIPDISKELHHEVELTVLIGKGGSSIAESSALSHVAGYGVGLDMTLRDIQADAKKKGLPWTLAKGFNTSAPVSQFIPADRVPAVPSLVIELKVNDNVRQKGNLSDLIFPVERVIAYLSRYITLEAGDVIFTGTPEGVAEAKPGDRLTAELRDAHGKTLTSLTVSVA